MEKLYIFKIQKRSTTIDDLTFSLAVRQSLLHWDKKINKDDFEMWKLKIEFKTILYLKIVPFQ